MINQDISQAAAYLSNHQVVAVPTETVYGLAANAYDDQAVASIYAIKQRPQFNPLIIHYASLEQMKEDVIITNTMRQLAAQFWPGPLTLVLEKHKTSRLSTLATAGGATVAVRIPKHPVMQALLQHLDFPLAAPSANPSGQLSPTEAAHVMTHLGDKLPMVLDGGPCQVGVESTILDLTTPRPMVLRPGVITADALAKALGDANIIANPYAHTSGETTLKAPGQLSSHYAPRHRVRLNVLSPTPTEALLAFGPIVPDHPQLLTLNLSPTAELTEAAANLFRYLHHLDALEVVGIAVMPIPNAGVGMAINDRLSRAAFDTNPT